MEMPMAMESSGCNAHVSEEQVIEKLKDEGDFDRLRLKIIRKLKENEELRNSIISAVKQSAALNREGAENLKPRQLSDAIHEEIRNEVMGQISDALWGVIRSDDGMRSEISETVESVYNRLLNPNGKEIKESLSVGGLTTSTTKMSNTDSLACEKEDTLSDSELKEPPGFSTCNYQQPSNDQGDHKEDLRPPTPHIQQHGNKIELPNQPHLLPSDKDPSVPPGFAPFVVSQQLYSGGDEDPDVPPGFG